MERHTILEMMGTLKLAGMRHAYDEVVADAVEVTVIDASL